MNLINSELYLNKNIKWRNKMKKNWHFIMSLIKSFLRIIGFMICIFNLTTGLAILIIAEGIGIIE